MFKFRSRLFILLALTFLGSQARANQPLFHKIYLQCSIAQGNGFNWASTVGWLAGTVEDLVDQASAFESQHPGKTAGVDISCFTGSSSSSFTAGLLDHLLNNKNLVPAPASKGHKILSVQQARHISQALYFLALSMDFTRAEKLTAGIAAVGARIGLTDTNSQTVPGNLWSPRVAARSVTALFNKWIAAADLIKLDWLGHFADARSLVNQQVQGQAAKRQSISDDFCVTGLAVPLEQATLPLNFDNLKLMYICNAATVARVMGRDLFEFLRSGRVMKNRFLIATTDTWSTAQNISVREPALTSELSGSLLRSPIGLSKVYELRDDGFHGLSSRGRYLIVGGFADPRMQAWVGTVLLKQRMRELEKQGIEVVGRVSVFGKLESRTDPDYSFAQQAVVRFFTSYPTDKNWKPAEATLNQYYLWQDDYCRALEKVGMGFSSDFYRMEWNLSPMPAAVTGQSQALTEMAYRVAKGKSLSCRL
jgi:hypothetical protein